MNQVEFFEEPDEAEMENHQQYEEEMRMSGVAPEHRPTYEEWLALPDEPDTETCPTHGTQEVVGSDTTGGPDPYGITVLACRCGVMAYGPGDPLHVVRTYTNRVMPRFGFDPENGPSPRDYEA